MEHSMDVVRGERFSGGKGDISSPSFAGVTFQRLFWLYADSRHTRVAYGVAKSEWPHRFGRNSLG
jgi:hypothetical protein